MRTAWRLAVPALLLGLLAGFWAGARLERSASLRARRAGPPIDKIHRRFVKKLRLDEAQSTKVRAVLDSRRERFAALRREGHDKAAALRQEMDREIEALLDERQKPIFAEMRARWEKKHAEGLRHAR